MDDNLEDFGDPMLQQANRALRARHDLAAVKRMERAEFDGKRVPTHVRMQMHMIERGARDVLVGLGVW